MNFSADHDHIRHHACSVEVDKLFAKNGGYYLTFQATRTTVVQRNGKENIFSTCFSELGQEAERQSKFERFGNFFTIYFFIFKNTTE